MKRNFAVLTVLIALVGLIAVPVWAQTAAPAPAPAKGDVWSKYDIRVYGRVKVDLHYDTVEFVRYNDFIGAIEGGTATTDYENDSTNFNPRDTRFGFEVSHTDGDWTGLGRFEIDFYGDNAVNNLEPRMRLGYVNMVNNATKTSILVGQDWIPVAQLNPNTVDFGILTAAGNLWWRVPQVTVRQKISDLELLVSAMRHRRVATNDEQIMPWLLGRVAYDLGMIGKGSYVALGGGYEEEEVVSTLSGQSEDVTRYLLALELRLAMGPFSLRAEPWIGQGIDDEFLRYDLGVNAARTTPIAIQSVGGFIDLTYAVTPKLALTVGYGIDDPKDEDVVGLTGNDRVFDKNTQTFVNAWYALTKAIKVGAEWIYVETERPDPIGDRDGNRFTVSTFYEF